jgi:phage N-6-adenine-methyltransferase
MIVNTELANSKGHKDKDLWETPEDLFKKLNDEFHFTLDPCCLPESARCNKSHTPLEDGLIQDWQGETVFCNPPYSRGNIDLWVKKCSEEGKKKDTIVVALIPVSTSAKWFHDHVWNKAEIRFIKGRVRFRGAPFTAPFSSMICIFKN